MPASTGANANINIRVDSDVKNKAQEVFAALGLDMTSAVNIFLRQAIRINGIPFELMNDKVRSNPSQLGCIQDKVKDSDGHDCFEPLDDFKEHM